MKKYIKLSFILPYILSLLLLNFNYFNSLKLIKIVPPNYIIVSLLIISYLSKYLSIFNIYSNFDIKYTKDYNKYLYTNMLFNVLTIFNLTILNNLFLVFSSITICLLSNLFLYYETKSYDKKLSIYLIPSVYLSLFCSIISLIIYFMNL